MDLSQKIDVCSNIDVKEFKTKYFKPQIPLIIRGLADREIAGNKWCINYFKETMGNEIIDLYDNNKKNVNSAFTSPDLKMKFSDYLDMIIDNKQTDFRIFLFNLFKLNPKLKYEFPCPKIFKGILDGKVFMFFGGKDTTVRIHQDIDMSNVLLTHFGGRKKVVLISPEYSDLLYCLPLNTYSLINIDKPDYNQHPALEFVKGYQCILEPGDSLFMPSGYWHYMTYLEGSFSVSYRKIAPTLKQKIIGFLNITTLMPIDKLLCKLLDKKWLDYKINLAEIRANHAIAKQFVALPNEA